MVSNCAATSASAFASSKPYNLRGKAGHLNRRGKMFPKLRTAKHLKLRVSTDSFSAGFFGRTAGVARVHHYGLRERGIRYSARELVGFSADDQELERDLLLKHLAG
ncbi:phage virion morphogenesis protein [Microbulbifer spongiae]|uniref:Phage virion morphogenesis protein n=1 Tax=Microbulbifer spongiae TaxID=2944933 RepID=A0ABY9E9T8_9GAMM|nr:phage virion morphogenesis protein [Microbulbifer sp. MI-G]WKD48661.1 phage virion morphogenesis protein [Microbulbifer sp. MI-G]